MSKSWKHWAADELETTNKFDILKIGVPDFSAQYRISIITFKTQDSFLFLPLLSKPASMKNDHLSQTCWTFWTLKGIFFGPEMTSIHPPRATAAIENELLSIASQVTLLFTLIQLILVWQY